MAVFYSFGAAIRVQFSLSEKLFISGFELTPNYLEEIELGCFPKVLRNLWLMSFSQLTLMILLAWAVVPYSNILSHSNNILSILSEYAVQAKWLRYCLFTAIGLAMFGIVGGNLTIIAGQFVIPFLIVIGLFAPSNIHTRC